MAVDKYSNTALTRLKSPVLLFFHGTLLVLQNIRPFFLPFVFVFIILGWSPLAFAQAVSTDDKLFNDAPAPDKGWQGLANVLEALSPGVDTSLPLTASQITDRIERMLNQGQAQEALEIIKKRQAQREASMEISEDVQLMFLHARALAATGRENEAEQVYRDMTIKYPELPEPWNNLASIYIKRKQLDKAHDALTMALTAFPDYATARYNLGQVQLMQAYESFSQAEQSGLSGASERADKVRAILD